MNWLDGAYPDQAGAANDAMRILSSEADNFLPPAEIALSLVHGRRRREAAAGYRMSRRHSPVVKTVAGKALKSHNAPSSKALTKLDVS